MSVEVQCKQHLSDEEAEQLFGWGTNIFESDHLNVEWAGPTSWRFIVYEAGKAVSHAGLLEHTIDVGQQPVKVGGICAVVTVPSARNKGYARNTLETAAQFTRDKLKVEFGFLFCLQRLIPFYSRLGWQAITDPVFIEQPAGKRQMPEGLHAMRLNCQNQVWPAGKVELNRFPW